MKIDYITKQGVFPDLLTTLNLLKRRGEENTLLSFRPVSVTKTMYLDKLYLVSKGIRGGRVVIVSANIVFYSDKKELAQVSFPHLPDLSLVNNSTGYFVIDLDSLGRVPFYLLDNKMQRVVSDLLGSKTAFRLYEREE